MQSTLHYVVGSVCNHSALVRQQEQRDSRAVHSGSCRRLERHRRWFNFVWTTYSDERFKKTFRVPFRVPTLLSNELDISLNEMA